MVGDVSVAPVEALAVIVTVLPSPLVMVLFHASRTTTVGCTPNAAPDTALLAATADLFVTTTWLGAPTVTVMALLTVVNVVVVESELTLS